MCKKIRSYIISAGIILICLNLSSCLTSKNPLGNVENAIEDRTIEGIWYMPDRDDPDNEGYIVVNQDEDNYLRVLTFDSEGTDLTEYTGYITAIGDDRYVNLKEIKYGEGPREESDTYILANYYIDGNNDMVVSLFDPVFFQKAIEEGKIKGVVAGKWFASVKLTEDIPGLYKFISENNKDKGYLDKNTVFRFKNLRKFPRSNDQ